MLRLTFNPGLALTGFRTTRPTTLLATEGIQTQTTVSNGNRTEWSPIRSVIIKAIRKSDDR